MPFLTGTATDLKDLLSQLETFATANNWVTESYTTTAGLEDPDELYLRGLGSTDTENVHVNFKTYGDAFNNIFTWDVRGATEYDALQPFETQPDVSPVSYFTCSGNAMNFWFYVSDRRIIVVTQIATSFFSMYAGFYLPFATPIDYPYPLYIAATSNTQEEASVLNSGSRDFGDPGTQCAWVRNTAGNWQECRNHNRVANQDDSRSNASGDQGFMVFPYTVGGGQSGDPQHCVGWDIRPPAGVPDALPVIPLQIFSTSYGLPFYGIMENAFWVAGFNLVSNQDFVLTTEAATGTLTFTGLAADGETVSIGRDVAASGSLTLPANNPANTDTVTIDAKTYTFQTVLTNVDGNVLIGATPQDTLDNLTAAINLDAGAGSLYAAATTLHPTVSASAAAGGNRTFLTAKAAGSAGNSIALTSGSLELEVSAPTLTGGSDIVVYTFRTSITPASPAYDVLVGADLTECRDNLAAAINRSAGEGITYAAGTPFNAEARGNLVSTDQIEVVARESGAQGNTIETLETVANASFGSATLTGGGGSETYRIFQNGQRTEKNHFFAIKEA